MHCAISASLPAPRKAAPPATAAPAPCCSTGIIMTSIALLEENPHPTRDEVRFGLQGNLCRCTGYDKIVDAVQAAAREMGGEAGTRARRLRPTGNTAMIGVEQAH